MITFTLSIILALLGLAGLAVGYWLGYRQGFLDGTEDATGVVDEGVGLRAPMASTGYTNDSIRSGTIPKELAEHLGQQWPKVLNADEGLKRMDRMWDESVREEIDPQRRGTNRS